VINIKALIHQQVMQNSAKSARDLPDRTLEAIQILLIKPYFSLLRQLLP
jgi:hypothetical protein